MKIVYKTSVWVLIGLGSLHILLTPLFYSAFTIDALWFAGTGLGLLSMGLFNLAALRAPARATANLCLITNFIGILYGILIIIVMPVPQVFLMVLAFLGAVVGLIFSKKPTLEEIK